MSTPDPSVLQAIFLKDEANVDAFVESISSARLGRYLHVSNKNTRQAIDLYCLNGKLSQAFYLLIQMWEVCLRNRIDAFLRWKYTDNWPQDQRLRRNLQKNDLRRLIEAIDRQSALRGQLPATNAVVADLSAGFWVGLLSKSYDVPFTWRYNIRRIFPQNVAESRVSAFDICSDLLDLRNRIAHHEPIYHLPLDDKRTQLMDQLRGMCPASHAYAEHFCTFSPLWETLVAAETAGGSTDAASGASPPASD